MYNFDTFSGDFGFRGGAHPSLNASNSISIEEVCGKYYLDLNSYVQSITIDVGEVLRRIEATVSELPKLRVVCSPDSPNWGRRLEEEFRVFEIFRDLQVRTVGYAAFDGLEQLSSRRFKCSYINARGRREEFEIRLALDYPKSMPSSKLTDGVCLGRYGKSWKKNGRWGIAHYLSHIAAPIMAIRGKF